jgi:hypothetical protein
MSYRESFVRGFSERHRSVPFHALSHSVQIGLGGVPILLLHHPILDMAATTASNGAHSLQGNPMSKTPNLRQPSTGPTIYAPMKLPPMVSIPLQPTIAPVRPAPAPLIPGNGPSRPLGSMTNTPNQVR